MNKQDVFDGLVDIFKDIFDDDEIILTETTTAEDIEEWDSFEQINILVAIEHKFSVKFSINEASEFKNVGDMVDGICKKLA